MDDDIQSLSMAIFRVGRAVRVSGSNVFQQEGAHGAPYSMKSVHRQESVAL